jgi:hypothetical protein
LGGVSQFGSDIPLTNHGQYVFTELWDALNGAAKVRAYDLTTGVYMGESTCSMDSAPSAHAAFIAYCGQNSGGGGSGESGFLLCDNWVINTNANAYPNIPTWGAVTSGPTFSAGVATIGRMTSQ